LVGISI